MTSTRWKVVLWVAGALLAAAFSGGVLIAVHEWNDPTAVSVRALSSRDPLERLEAARALADPDPGGADRAVDALMRAVADDDVAVRGAAARSLAYLVLLTRTSLPPARVVEACHLADPLLGERVADERIDDVTRIDLLRVMGQLPRDAGMETGRAALLHALVSQSEAVREAAAREARAFEVFSTTVAPALIDALKDASPKVRLAASTSLVWFKSVDPAVAPRLLALLDDGGIDASIRRSVTMTLGAVKPPSPEVVKRLIAIVDDIRSPIRGAAAYALERVGAPAAEPALPALRRATTDFDPHVRDPALRAIAAIEKPAKSGAGDAPKAKLTP
jgi:HEAT repeat protein